MTTPKDPVEGFKLTVWATAIAGTFLLMAILVWAMVHYTRPDDLSAARVQERFQFLAEVRAAEAKLTSEYAWRDKEKGLVILPIERAMELTLQEWHHPEAARSNLLALLEKAMQQPPPPPPPVNPYE
jgi:Zn-dependent protease with chaperone function